MATKRPKRRFNLFDEEFGDTPEQPVAVPKGQTEDAVGRRIRIRQAIVDLPFESKLDFLRSESKSTSDLEDLKTTFLGNAVSRDEGRPPQNVNAEEPGSLISKAATVKSEQETSALSQADSIAQNLISEPDALKSPVLNSSESLGPCIDQSVRIDSEQNAQIHKPKVETDKGAIAKQLGSNKRARPKKADSKPPIEEQLESNKGAETTSLASRSIEEQLGSKSNSAIDIALPNSEAVKLGSSKGAETSPVVNAQTLIGEQLGSGEYQAVYVQLPPKTDAATPESSLQFNRSVFEEQLRSKYIVSTSNFPAPLPKVSIGEQLGSRNLPPQSIPNKEAIGEQLGSTRPFIEKQLGSKTAPQLSELGSNKGANKGATREQLGSTARSFYEVTGKEREFLIFTFQQIIQSGTDRTLPMSTDALRATFDLTSARLTNIVKRLSAKGVLIVHKGQRGKGGWRVFGLPQNIYQDIRQSTSYQDPIKERLGSNRGAYKGATKGAEVSSSSSSSNSSLNENTTKADESIWVSIPESLKGLVSVAQMRNLIKSGVVDEETLEDSLFGFAHDLSNNLVRSKTGNPIALLVGAIKNGGYISQHYLANKKAELLELQKRVAELRQVRDDFENEKLNVEFEKFQIESPEKFEALKSSLSFMKNFEAGSPGYKVLLQKFKDSRANAAQLSK